MEVQHLSYTSSCAMPRTAVEELTAQIKDCASVLMCINTEDALRSIEQLSPRGRTVKACITWSAGPSAATRDTIKSVQVRFSYSGAFACCEGGGGERFYESLMALLVANGCVALDIT